jgi:hypothetical protein
MVREWTVARETGLTWLIVVAKRTHYSIILIVDFASLYTPDYANFINLDFNPINPNLELYARAITSIRLINAFTPSDWDLPVIVAYFMGIMDSWQRLP